MLRALLKICFTSLFLAACEESYQPQVVTQSLKVTDVEVILEAQPERAAKRNNLTKAEVTSIMEGEIRKRLLGLEPDGTIPIKVVVQPTRMFIANPATSIIAGGSVSNVNTKVSIKNAINGTVIAEGIEVGSVSQGRVAGIVGAVLVKSPPEEIALFSARVGRKIRDILFEERRELDAAALRTRENKSTDKKAKANSITETLIAEREARQKCARSISAFCKDPVTGRIVKDPVTGKPLPNTY